MRNIFLYGFYIQDAESFQLMVIGILGWSYTYWRWSW